MPSQSCNLFIHFSTRVTLLSMGFNIPKFQLLTTSCVFVFHMTLRIKRAIISVHKTEWLILRRSLRRKKDVLFGARVCHSVCSSVMTERKCVYCAVGTEYLNIIQVIFLRSMPCHGSDGYLPSCHHGGPGSTPGQSVRDFWRKVGGESISPSTSVFLCQCHSTNAPGSSSSPCCCHRKDRRSKPENPLKSSCIPGSIW